VRQALPVFRWSWGNASLAVSSRTWRKGIQRLHALGEFVASSSHYSTPRSEGRRTFSAKKSLQEEKLKQKRQAS